MIKKQQGRLKHLLQPDDPSRTRRGGRADALIYPFYFATLKAMWYNKGYS